MKAKWVLLLIGLGAIGAFLWSRRSPAPSPEVPFGEAGAALPPGAEPQAGLPSPRYRALQAAPRDPIAPKAADALSPECTAFFQSLQALDFEKAFSSDKGELPSGSRCQAPPGPLQAAHARYVQDCARYRETLARAATPEQGHIALAGCFLAANLYRASLTDWLTRDKKLSDITDPKVLSDKLAAKLFQDPAGAAEVAERLLEIEPDLPPAAKAAAIARFLDAQARAGGDPRSPLWGKLDDAFSAAQKSNPQDPSLTEVQLVSEMLRNSDPTASRNRVESMRAQNPQLAEYLLSWMDYRSGNTSGALSRLQALQNSGSRDPRIADSIRKIQEGQKDAFTTNVQLPVDVVAPAPPGQPPPPPGKALPPPGK